MPIYARRFTLALLRFKLDEHRLLDKAELIEVRPGVPVQVGPFETEFVPLTHSTPDCAAVALSTAAGTSCTPATSASSTSPWSGRRSDLPALARLGDRGVRLLLADSTNAEEGPPPSPLPTRDVQSELGRIFATARGRVLVTTFSSHIHRVQQVLERGVPRRPRRRPGGPLADAQREDGEQPGRPRAPARDHLPDAAAGHAGAA